MRNLSGRAKRRPSACNLLLALILFAASVARAQDRVVSLQGFVEFDTLSVTIDTTGTDTLYFSMPNASFQKINNVVGKTPDASLNSPQSVLPYRVFNTGNATLFFRSYVDSTVCDSGYVKVQPLLYNGVVVRGDSVTSGSTTADSDTGPLSSYSGWRYVDLTSEFVMYSAIRVIISVGDLTHGWRGVVAFGRVR